MLARYAAALLLTGCMSELTYPPVEGTPADVTTPAGDYDAYRVVTSCPTGYADLGVIGTGSVPVTLRDDIIATGHELFLLLSDTPSVWGGGGLGFSCEEGIGTNIELDDWRDVDHVIAVVGAYLRDRDLALQVGITVDTPPVTNNAPAP